MVTTITLLPVFMKHLLSGQGITRAEFSIDQKASFVNEVINKSRAGAVAVLKVHLLS